MGLAGVAEIGLRTPRHHARELSPGDSGARGPGAEAGPSGRKSVGATDGRRLRTSGVCVPVKSQSVGLSNVVCGAVKSQSVGLSNVVCGAVKSQSVGLSNVVCGAVKSQSVGLSNVVCGAVKNQSVGLTSFVVQ